MVESGGTIKVYSEPSRGTTFKAFFRALETAGDGQPARELAALAQWRGTGAILLADGEESLRALGAAMPERIGFTVLTAADGRAAVDLYRERASEIDLVVLDLTMPHIDGIEAFSELRRMDPDIRAWSWPPAIPGRTWPRALRARAWPECYRSPTPYPVCASCSPN
ncbi:MAG: response regulator [Chloroflexi bacterium]|nr:response regulator [Chloroflexota bacterium]